MRLEDMPRAVLQEAVALYLEEAYGGAPLPGVVEGRLEWPEGATVAEVARGEAFERTPTDVAPEAGRHVRLRLGNRAYPHMKLALDRVPDSGDWVLSVDSHDRMLLVAEGEDASEALRAVVEANTELKVRIERRWAEAGLPTFEQYVHEKLHPKGGPPSSDQQGP